MPDIQIRSADELPTGVSLQPVDFHNLVNNASVQSGVIADQNEVSSLESADEILIKENSSGSLRKIQWSNVAAEVAADFVLTTSSVDEGKSDFYENWDTPDTAKSRLVTDGFLPITKAATSEHPVIDVMAYGALGDNSGTVVAQWLSGGTYDRGYSNLAAIQADYPWVESLLDTIDFAACQKALDVAWQKIKSTYGKGENTAGGLQAQSSSDSELDKSRTARAVTVLFPAGWYKINKTLIVPPSCNVQGSGSGSTVIRYTGDTFTSTGVKKTTDYNDSITVGSESETLARTLTKRKWKYYSDKTDYKVPLRINGMHAIMLVRDELTYTAANATTGIYHAVGTVTAGASLSASTTFTVDNASGYAEGATSIAYDNGSTLSATTFYAEGGSYYTSTNDLDASGTLTGGTLTNPFSGVYYEDGVDDNEKFYSRQTLTLASNTSQRIYPGTKINFPNGVFVVAANENTNSSSLDGYVESGSIANTDVGTIDVYSQGYNPTGSEQAADESLAGNKNRVRDMDAGISGIQFSSYVEDNTIGLWLPGFTHENNKYNDLAFRGFNSFSSSDISGTPSNASKGMFGVMLNSGSSNQTRTLGVDLKFLANKFEACYVGLLATGDSQGIIFNDNHIRYSRFGVRMNGLHHTVSNNRFDGFTASGSGDDYIPHRIGETAVYLRYPVGCIINGNSIEHQQRAVELYGTTNVSVNGNSITVPDPSGRTGTSHDYTQTHGFVVHATAATYAYAEDGDGDAYRHNAGLLVTGNNWKYNDYTPATYSPLYVNDDSNKYVYGSAYGNGSWPTNVSIETLRTGSSDFPNHSVRFVVDENKLNKVHAANNFTSVGLASVGGYGELNPNDLYGIARGTFNNDAGDCIVLLPNPKLGSSAYPQLAGNEFYLSIYKNHASGGAMTIKVKSGCKVTGLSIAGGKLRVTTSLSHGLEAGDKFVLELVVNNGTEADGTFNKIHTVSTTPTSSTVVDTTTSISGTINITQTGGYGHMYFPQKMIGKGYLVSADTSTNGGGATGLNDYVSVFDTADAAVGSSAQAIKTFSKCVLDVTAGSDGHWAILE